jgi:hypothetical protein
MRNSGHFKFRTMRVNLIHPESRSHQDISVHGIGSLEDRRSGISIVKVLGAIWTVRFWIHVVEIGDPSVHRLPGF